ncbi:MAG TPA: peptide chain release factor N(5)-glutamine methyltransferase [Candidatus Binatia bacterium]|nr:peptide chain release factor N(5)-glutamine methyltransferase [Candidatus Binatia bacterium]
MATIDELLREGVERLRDSGSESPRLDAELLLARAIMADRTAVLAHPTAMVGDGQRERYEADLERRAAGEPVAYIRGFKEFFGLAFSTDERALIPRPETELLVELGEREVMDRLIAAPRPAGTQPLRVADIGTGCGTVAVALLAGLRKRKSHHEVEVIATDISPDALSLAMENAVGHGVADRVRFVEADLLPPVVSFPFEVILANLPYVATDAVDGLPIAASFEPRVALDGGPDGLDLIRRLLTRLPEALADGGVAFLEIGSDQAETAVAAVTEALPGWWTTVHDDLAGQPRVLRLGRS